MKLFVAVLLALCALVYSYPRPESDEIQQQETLDTVNTPLVVYVDGDHRRAARGGCCGGGGGGGYRGGGYGGGGRGGYGGGGRGGYGGGGIGYPSGSGSYSQSTAQASSYGFGR